MSHLRQSLIVAGWEFRRYFKWKDQIIGLVFFLGISGLWYGVAKVLQGRGRTVTIAVVDVNLQAPPSSRIEFVSAPPNDSTHLEGLRSGEFDGVLRHGSDGAFDLLVEQDPRYQAELQTILTATSRGERLAASGLSPRDLAAINAPAQLDIRFTDPTRLQTGSAEKVVAGVLIGIMLVSVFTSMAYLMTGITGEKQLRVTESVVAAISPQAWIDGKVAGLTAYSLTGIGNLAVGGLIVGIGAKLATDFTIPELAIRPAIVLVIAVVAILGMILWNCFFAAVAATIDDPNTSTRSSMLMLPVIPVGLAVVVFRDPDSLLSYFLSVFPLTSAPALPARLVLASPGIIEILASVLLLIGAIWLTRRIAGRIFEVGMLMYGKEPSWGEIARWVSRPAP